MKEKREISSETPTIDGLVRGNQVWAHPADVLGDPHMSKAEKRALLASWASDFRAVKDAPTCRQLDSGAVVDVSEIMHALRSLDAGASASPAPYMAKGQPYYARRPHGLISRYRQKMGRRDGSDDDNDPPPCPAAAAPRGKKAAATYGAWGAMPEWA